MKSVRIKNNELDLFLKVEQLYNHENSLSDIQRQIGLSRARISNYLKGKGYTIRRSHGSPLEILSGNCLLCGEAFSYKNLSGIRKYCNSSCWDAARGKKQEYTCECGENFSRYPSMNKGPIAYCSPECGSMYHTNKFTEEAFRCKNKFQYFRPSDKLGIYDDIYIRSRKCANYNHYFFQKGIVDERTAYAFGVILTDGGLVKHNDFYNLTLGLVDEDIVNQIAQVMDHPKVPYTYIQNNKNGSTTTVHRITIPSDRLVHDLGCIGCPPRKTDLVTYPSIPKELDRHFIRGLLDGDGSWTTRKRDNSRDLKFGCNDHLVYGVYLKLKEHLEVAPSSLEYPSDYDKKYKMTSYAVLRYSTLRARLIREFIYDGATIYGRRKKDLAYMVE